jgi:hypothetical protein
MATDATRRPSSEKNLRVLSAFNAILTIFNTMPWSQSSHVHLAAGFAGALAFSSFAIFGNRTGWFRPVALVAMAAYVVLSFWQVAIFAA